MVSDIKLTPLALEHEKLGARMLPFAGYNMPIQYKSIIAESKAVRESAGMFDVSHMARLKFTGEEVIPFLQWITTNDIEKLVDHKGQYSLLPNDRGGCVDDIIVYRENKQAFLMVVNAANHEKDFAWIRSQNRWNVAIEDQTAKTAMIAVQGPQATSILEKIFLINLNELSMFETKHVVHNDETYFFARSGYTGEDGFEIICSATLAAPLWESLLNAGVAPCGLGSRDVLRVEAGLPLYGHELSEEQALSEAGLGWAICKTKSFVGSDFVLDNASPSKKLVGIRLESKRLPAAGIEVLVEDLPVGTITSGIYSPLLECGIGFAYIDSSIALNTVCQIDLRGSREMGQIVSKRFLQHFKG
jgi:aminomethyltransferase